MNNFGKNQIFKKCEKNILEFYQKKNSKNKSLIFISKLTNTFFLILLKRNNRLVDN